MTEPKPPQPLADDIPIDSAWKIGRRVYVRCGIESQLNTQLREIGASWDRDVKALWVGTGKLDKVLPLVRARAERAAHVQAVKATGTRITIPYEATDLRAAAKAAGAVWDAEAKAWSVPATPAGDEVRAQVRAWKERRAAEIQAERAAQQTQWAADRAAAAAEDRADRARMAADAAERVIARTDRTVTDQRGTTSGRLAGGRMYRAEAEQRKPQPGTVRRLADGRRVLVLACSVTFVGQDDIDDGMTAGGTGDEPGWVFRYTWAAVEPTAAEVAEDVAEAAALADEQELAALVRDAEQAAGRSEAAAQTPRRTGATITETGASWANVFGTVTLTPDGACWWRHPGYYDDYRAVAGPIVDEQIITRVRAAIAGGTRTRGRYQVRTEESQ